MTRQDAFQMFLLSAAWGISFLLIKLGGEVFPPVWVALLRAVFGALVLWAALRLGGVERGVREVPRRGVGAARAR